MSINVLLTLVEQYKEAAQLIEAAQAEQEQLKIQIREALAERSTNYLEVGCHKIRLSDFSSTRLDSKAIKAGRTSRWANVWRGLICSAPEAEARHRAAARPEHPNRPRPRAAPGGGYAPSAEPSSEAPRKCASSVPTAWRCS